MSAEEKGELLSQRCQMAVEEAYGNAEEMEGHENFDMLHFLSDTLERDATYLQEGDPQSSSSDAIVAIGAADTKAVFETEVAAQ